MLGWEGLPGRTERTQFGNRDNPRQASPSGGDEGAVLSRADVLQDEGLVAGRQVDVGQVGLADVQPVGGVLAGGQLEDVGDQGCGAQTKDVDACEETAVSMSSRGSGRTAPPSPMKRTALRM